MQGWVRIYDGCLRYTHRDLATGRVTTVRKRRPAGADPGVCTWVVPCPDHPVR